MPDLPSNPLLPLHQQTAGAEFQPYGQLEIVSTFGEPQAEYAAIRKGAALMDLPQRGLLELTGKDRHAFLNNLLTNQTWDKQTKTGLAPGSGVYAFFLNLKGRIVADMNVIELREVARTLLELDVRLVETIRASFDKYIFAEQVKVTSKVGTLHQFALFGPRVAELLPELSLSPMPLASAQLRLLDQHDVIAVRDDLTGSPGYRLIVAGESAPALWSGLLARFEPAADEFQVAKRALRPVGWAAFNATRIEAGTPLFGIDFDDSVLPAETGHLLNRAVSFTKGCYLGQEIVARMYARGQLARQLVGIKMDDDALPIAGNQIFDDASNVIGGVTSSTMSPVLSNTPLVLGYVKKPFIESGTKVTIPAEGAMHRGTVSQLPFVNSPSP